MLLHETKKSEPFKRHSLNDVSVVWTGNLGAAMEARLGRSRSVPSQALCEHRLATSRAATNLVECLCNDLNLFGFNNLVLSVRRDALADLWATLGAAVASTWRKPTLAWPSTEVSVGARSSRESPLADRGAAHPRASGRSQSLGQKTVSVAAVRGTIRCGARR